MISSAPAKNIAENAGTQCMPQVFHRSAIFRARFMIEGEE
jgi:hypothetical protein